MVLVSSAAATGGSSSFAYGASKGGVHNLGITLANALAADNIRVNVLSPGNIDTAHEALGHCGAGGSARARPSSLSRQWPTPSWARRRAWRSVLAWLASDDADYVRGVIATR